MIDLNKAREEFINYTNNYDKDNPHINRKIYHTFRVMEWSEKIARNLNLSEEDVKLASLIGLLHDIGRFEQRKRYDTFSDVESIDHGNFGVQILEENNYIRKYIKTNEFDNIIKKAIMNHNKFKIEDGLDERTLLHSKIVRDADKLDIFYEGVHLFYGDKVEYENIRESYISQVMNKKSIYREGKENGTEKMIGLISFVFDINFDYSRSEIVKENFINDILKKLEFKNEESKRQINELEELVNKYLKGE